MNNTPVLLLYAVLALTTAPALAESSPHAPDPNDVRARVPGVEYRSAFERYVPYRDATLAPWREINDEAARVGGHLGIFSTAREPRTNHSHRPTADPGNTSASERAGGRSPAHGTPAHGH